MSTGPGRAARPPAAGLALALVAVLGPAAPASADVQVLAKHDANCTALAKDYPHGVSKNDLTTKQWTARGATARPALRPGVYTENKASLDRDKDFIACEQ